MSKVSDAMREHHRGLVETLSEKVAQLNEQPARGDPADLVTFLTKDLLPHAQGEERALYPVIDDLVKMHGRATATMSVDHEFIGEYIRQIEEKARRLATAGAGQRAQLEGELGRLALQLAAVFRVHLEKEERVYLPLFDRYLADEEQQRILDSMHEAYGPAT